MYPKTRTILEGAVELGIERGWHRGVKYCEGAVDKATVCDNIERAIWEEIDRLFVVVDPAEFTEE